MEKILQKYCVEYAKSKGLLVWSNNPPAHHRVTFGTMFGIPDLTISNTLGKVIMIELKDKQYTNANKKHQERQKRVRQKFWDFGIPAYKVDTLRKFQQILEFNYGQTF